MSVCVSEVPNPVTPFLPLPRSSSLCRQSRFRLAETTYPALRRVEIEDRQGTLILTGRVSTFYLKQVAQAVVARVKGVKSIVNRIEVVDAVK